MGTRVLVAAVMLAACYSPTAPENVECSPSGYCPTGQSCSNGKCTSMVTMAVDAPIAIESPIPPLDGPVEHDAPRVDALPPDAPVSAAFDLSGARWLEPCEGGSGSICTCSEYTQQVVTVSVAGTVDVTATIRGVTELATYSGGSAGPGNAYFGGGNSNGFANLYSIQISSPPQTIFVNNQVGSAAATGIATLDYSVEFELTGSATVTFASNSQDTGEEKNVGSNGEPISLPGVTEPPQPFNGQFVRLDVQSVTP